MGARASPDEAADYREEWYRRPWLSARRLYRTLPGCRHPAAVHRPPARHRLSGGRPSTSPPTVGDILTLSPERVAPVIWAPGGRATCGCGVRRSSPARTQGFEEPLPASTCSTFALTENLEDSRHGRGVLPFKAVGWELRQTPPPTPAGCGPSSPTMRTGSSGSLLARGPQAPRPVGSGPWVSGRSASGGAPGRRTAWGQDRDRHADEQPDTAQAGLRMFWLMIREEQLQEVLRRWPW